MKFRHGARVVLLDPQDRVLLLQVRDNSVVYFNRSLPENFWITPGGGLEAGESFEQAARREVWEETGLVDFELGPCICTQDQTLSWRGVPVRTFEHFYLGRTRHTEVTLDHATEQEREVLRAFRWWSLSELRATAETILPLKLVKVLGHVLKE